MDNAYCFNNLTFIEEVKEAYSRVDTPDDALSVLQTYTEDVFQFNAGIFTMSVINALVPRKFFDLSSLSGLTRYIREQNGIIYYDN